MSAQSVVLFACVHNAGRSQMAAAWLNRLADPGKAVAISAGTAPGPSVHPEVLAVMREVGIDLASAKPQKLTDELAGTAQFLITMGCGDACPVVPGAVRDDWPLDDPKGQSADAVRSIRNQVFDRVTRLIDTHRWHHVGLGPSPLRNPDEILAMITAFRNGTLRKEGFTHRAHLLVGLWYLDHFSVDEVRRLVPEAIRRHNARVGTVETPRGGYHETITQFYLSELARFRGSFPSGDWVRRPAALFERFDDRGLILRDYTEELLWSAEARGRWVEPDRHTPKPPCFPSLGE